MEREKWYPLIKQIDDCFLALNGEPLPCPEHVEDRYQWLHEEANYGILAHDASADPVFIYVNEYALSSFKYTRDEMLLLPSKYCVKALDREERDLLLKNVREDGINYTYSGDRIDKLGNSFTIYGATIWELKDQNGIRLGQGALFYIEEKEK